METDRWAEEARTQCSLVFRNHFVLVLLHSLQFCGIVERAPDWDPGVFHSSDSAASYVSYSQLFNPCGHDFMICKMRGLA